MRSGRPGAADWLELGRGGGPARPRRPGARARPLRPGAQRGSGHRAPASGATLGDPGGALPGPARDLRACGCLRRLSPPPSPARAPRPGEGTGSGLCLPPHAPPRGPDSGVWGRTGDARPVYPPRAASAPTGGAAQGREGSLPGLGPAPGAPPSDASPQPPPSDSESRPPGCLLPQTRSPDPQILLSQTRSVCRLVLVVLSLWPDHVFAPGSPPGPVRASPDLRAELDSTVLQTRALLADTRQLTAQLKDKFPADGDHSLDSLPTLAMSAGSLAALQIPGLLTRLRADLQCYLRHVQWLRRIGVTSLRTLEPELGGLQTRLDRLVRRLQHLMFRLALTQGPPDQPVPPLASPSSAWGGIRAAHAVLGGLHLTLDWAVRGLMMLKTRL
ncbi:interleukin-11 [Rhynchocyon petersi]